ncbi:MAG: rhodanese-like domain-containing protein [Acidimicrobiia bacterium]
MTLHEVVLLTIADLGSPLGGADLLDLLDVRQPAEWAEGHVRGATFITGGELPRRLDEVPRTGRALAVACGSGYRSSVSASLIDGRTDVEVVNVLGGMTAWNAARVSDH